MSGECNAASVREHRWLTPEEAKTIQDVLIEVWLDAEANDDDRTVERVKAALDHLSLPWVRL